MHIVYLWLFLHILPTSVRLPSSPWVLVQVFCPCLNSPSLPRQVTIRPAKNKVSSSLPLFTQSPPSSMPTSVLSHTQFCLLPLSSYTWLFTMGILNKKYCRTQFFSFLILSTASFLNKQATLSKPLLWTWDISCFSVFFCDCQVTAHFLLWPFFDLPPTASMVLAGPGKLHREMWELRPRRASVLFLILHCACG